MKNILLPESRPTFLTQLRLLPNQLGLLANQLAVKEFRLTPFCQRIISTVRTEFGHIMAGVTEFGHVLARLAAAGLGSACYAPVVATTQRVNRERFREGRTSVLPPLIDY